MVKWAVILVIFLLPSEPRAHGEAQWIMDLDYRSLDTGDRCCGPKDCFPVPDQAVEYSGRDHAYLVKWKKKIYKVPADQVHYTPNDHAWVCATLSPYQGSLQRTRIRCLFVKPVIF